VLITRKKSLIFFGICAIFTCCITTNAMARDVSCYPGWYVSQCGSIVIGTNILKGYADGDWDYYDYQDPANNLVNLRNFFSHHANSTVMLSPIVYRDINNVEHSVSPDDYLQKRKSVLKNVCNPDEVDIVCLKCPDGGSSNSVVITSSQPADNWRFSTFANCFKTTLNDSTGSYAYYYPDDRTESCYYNIDIPGSLLHSGISADVNSNTTGNGGGSSDD